MGSESHVRVYQPWIVNDYGYTTSVVAKLVRLEATTSLEYRRLVEADVLDVSSLNATVMLLVTLQRSVAKCSSCVVAFPVGFSHRISARLERDPALVH